MATIGFVRPLVSFNSTWLLLIGYMTHITLNYTILMDCDIDLIYTIVKRWNITNINLKCLFVQIACFASVKSSVNLEYN